MTQPMTADEFRDRIRGTMVKCAMPNCTHRGFSLTEHLREKHDMSPGAYQKMFPRETHPDARLWSPVLGELLKNLGRTPRTSSAFEAQLPMYERKEGLQKDIIKLCQNVARPANVEASLIPEINPDFYFDENVTPRVAAGVAAGMHVFMSGPTGCGKTELCYQLHAGIKKPLLRINLNGDASRATTVGEMRANPQQGTYFHYGALPTAMKQGLTLVLDEVDYGPPHILAVCNSVLDRGSIYIEETGETINAQPGFSVIATGNTGGKGDVNGNYTGTEVLNTAFLDRFPVKVTMSYLPEAEEIKMLINRFPKEDGKRIELMVKFATEVRTSFVKGALSLTLSTRKLIEILRLTQILGFDIAMECGIMDWLDKDDWTLVEGLATRVGITLKKATK